MGWEIWILKTLENIRGENLNKLFKVITITGESVPILIIISVVYWCINKRLGQKLGFIMLFSSMINGVIKNLVKAPRPFEVGVIEPLRRHTATGYSFPSGHTQAATTLWTTFITNFRKIWVYCCGTIVILLVALSRLYLGVHWPIDVMAAIVVGVVCTIIGEEFFERIQDVSIKKIFLIASIIMLSTLVLSLDYDYIKSAGSITGFLIGFILEKRYVLFTTVGSFKFQIYKLIIGLTGLVIIYSGLKIFTPQLLVFGFLRYMMIVIWMIAGAPYVFMRIKK